MTYRPTESFYGAPWVTRLPSLLYLVLALIAVAVVIVGEMSPTNSWLYVKVVEEDVHHVISSRTFAVVLLLSAVAATIRTGMRGVHVRGDAVEFRDVVSLGWPRVRRFKWAQIDRIVLDSPRQICLDLWDGTRAFLPQVSDCHGLAQTLEKVAAARAIPVSGGKGLDEIPESEDYEDDGS